MSTLRHDLRQAFRQLARNPGFALVAVLTLGLGVGATTAIFSVVHAVILEPLPYPNADRLAVIWERNFPRDRQRNVVASVNFLDWRARSRSFVEIAAVQSGSVTLTGETPERVGAAAVTPGYFEVLGVPPALGRRFAPEEAERDEAVVVLSHELWQRRFAGDPDAIGSSISLEGEPHTVIGVMPKGFEPPAVFSPPSIGLWVPLDPNPEYSGRSLVVLARLKPDVAFAQARTEMETIAGALEREHEYDRGWGVNLVPLRDEIVADARPALLIILGAVALLLLIACANVANLLLTRATSRGREIAVRTALGAGQSRVVRQLLTESVLLGVLGGALGVVLALWGTGTLLALAPADLPRLDEVGIDGAVLGFALLVSIASALIFGSVPALRASKPDLRRTLVEGGERGSTPARGRLRGGLVVAETAVALILLVGAGLLGRNFLQLHAVDPGFDAENVLTFRLSLPSTAYPEDRQVVEFYRQLLGRIEALPGVGSAAADMVLPFGGLGIGTSFVVEGRPDPGVRDRPVADIRPVTPGYFRTMGVPLREGRDFDERDDGDGPTRIIINETMAERFWPGASALGRTVRVSLGEMTPARVVGVVGDVNLQALDQTPRSTIYFPHTQLPVPGMSVAVRSSIDSDDLLGNIRQVLRALDPNLPVYDVFAMTERVNRSLARERFTMTVLIVFAAVALLLAAVGLYGVLSYSVRQRTREIGIRRALGAGTDRLVGGVVRDALVLAGIGTAVGIVGALGLTRVIESLLYEISPTDPVTLLAVAALLPAIALLAAYVPARRAAHVDPMVALRQE